MRYLSYKFGTALACAVSFKILRMQVATKVVVRAMEEAALPDWQEEDEDLSCRSSQDTGSVSFGFCE